ncbi:MAG: RAMP superfamily CRISPR-associated protein [Nitrososphaerota archaeon]|nr:RAMP superfamily CRISPR-associated protein [Nitrososphaerota archaeon]
MGRFTFRCHSGLQIGVRGEGTQRFALRVGENLLIPSTSWKGAFRSVSEKIIGSMDLSGVVALLRELYGEDEDGVAFKDRNGGTGTFDRVLDQLTANPGQLIRELERLVVGNEELMSRLRGIRESNELKRFLKEEREGKSLTQRYLGLLYPITSLYGSPGLAGKLRFLDTVAKAVTHWRPGVGINRSTMRSEEGVIYGTEVLVPLGQKITLSMLIDNVLPATTEAGILASTIELIKSEGIRIGSSKSRGLGNLELVEEESWIKVMDISDKVDADVKIRYVTSPRNWTHLSLKEALTWLEGGDDI